MRYLAGAPEARIAREAKETVESLWRTRPRTAVAEMRLFGEALSKAVGAAFGLPREDREEQDKYLKRLLDDGALSQIEFSAFDTLRWVGNKAAHAEELTDSQKGQARAAFDRLASELGGPKVGPAELVATVGGHSSALPAVREATGSPVVADPRHGRLQSGREQQRTIQTLARTVLGVAMVFAVVVVCLRVWPDIARFGERLMQPKPVASTPEDLGGLTSYVVTAGRKHSPTSVYAKPSAGELPIASLRYGQIVSGDTAQDGSDGLRWIRLRLDDGQTGWVQASAVQMAPPSVATAEFGSGEDTGRLLNYTPEREFYGLSSPVSIRVEWRNASENKSTIDVRTDPPTSGVNCVWRLPTVNGAAICDLGRFPPGRYRALIAVNNQASKPISFAVYATEGNGAASNIECGRAATWADRMVCHDDRLARRHAALVNTSGEDQAWKARRQACRKADDPRQCLYDMYEARTQERAETGENQAWLAARPPRPTSTPSWAPATPTLAYPPEAINPSLWIRGGDYPERARIERRQGVSRIGWEVTPEGRVENCRVVDSSGSTDLDEAACRLVTRRARYRPARDTSGQPLRTSISKDIRWQLND